MRHAIVGAALDYGRGMPDQPRVAVYLDFDNLVISRYDEVHGDGRWRKDNARNHAPGGADDTVGTRLKVAEVDIGAVIDYASGFGTVALTRAYADWSVPANAAYKHQLIDRAVDLVQMFATSGTKNGADIRLSIDAIDDLFQHDDITHVVIAGGDSDYIPLAQRCKRMGRYVVGIGVEGSISRALVAACDEFSSYADLPDVEPPAPAVVEEPESEGSEGRDKPKRSRRGGGKAKQTPQERAGQLLVRAIRVGMEKSDDGWLNSSGVKSQMQRLDSAFKEKSLGFSSYRAFVESYPDLVETKTLDNGQLAVRLT